MPIIEVNMLTGRTADQKRRLIKELSLLVSEILEVPNEKVRVIIREVPPEHWGIGGVSVREHSMSDKQLK